jgi:plastocyanin
MTDETMETPAGETPAEEPSAEAVPATTTAVEAADAHENVPFWRRPNVERYLLPLVTPIVVVLAIVIFVLNLSRVFLASHGHVPVVVGSIITIVLLAGATLISNARHVKSQSVILTTCGFIIIAIGAGWLVLGHSEVKEEGGTALAAQGPCKETLAFEALSNLKFAPASLTVETGVYCITLTDQAAGQHTIDFDDPATLFPGLEVVAAGETKEGRIFFGEPGEYTFYCAVPGHRAAGMEGTVTVTGDPITLAEAEAAAGEGGGASGGTGATGAPGAGGATGATGSAG